MNFSWSLYGPSRLTSTGTYYFNKTFPGVYLSFPLQTLNSQIIFSILLTVLTVKDRTKTFDRQTADSSTSIIVQIDLAIQATATTNNYNTSSTHYVRQAILRLQLWPLLNPNSYPMPTRIIQSALPYMRVPRGETHLHGNVLPPVL